MKILIIFLCLIIPVIDIIGNKQIDVEVLELNHIYDSDWNYLIDQLVFWKFYEDEYVPVMFISLGNARNNDWNARQAANAQGLAYVPKFNWPYEIKNNPHSYVVISIDNIGTKIPVRINYKIFRETHSNFDTELQGKYYLEDKYKETEPEKWERIRKHFLFNRDWTLWSDKK